VQRLLVDAPPLLQEDHARLALHTEEEAGAGRRTEGDGLAVTFGSERGHASGRVCARSQAWEPCCDAQREEQPGCAAHARRYAARKACGGIETMSVQTAAEEARICGDISHQAPQ